MHNSAADMLESEKGDNNRKSAV